jgi:hypothetical protein
MHPIKPIKDQFMIIYVTIIMHKNKVILIDNYYTSKK